MKKKRSIKKSISKRSPKTISYLLNNSFGACWDYGFLLGLELAKLRDMKKYFDETNITTEETYEQIRRSISWCIYLLECIEENKHWDENKYVNVKTCTNKDLVSQYNEAEEGTRLLDLKIHGKPIEFNEKMVIKYEIWQEKCHRLYHLLRYNYEKLWWD